MSSTATFRDYRVPQTASPHPTANTALADSLAAALRAASGMRLELVGLDGATVYLPSEQIGATVGALRRWEAARAGLPSPSLLRLKSGCRDLCSDEAPLSEVDARVQALLRLPGGTHNKYFFSGRLEGVRKIQRFLGFAESELTYLYDIAVWGNTPSSLPLCRRRENPRD